MNKLLFSLTFLLLVVSFALGNEVKKQDQNNKIVGVWKSVEEVNRKPQAVLTIKNAGNGLEGSFTYNDLTVNGQRDAAVDLPLTNIAFNGTTCSFQVTIQQRAVKVLVWDWEFKIQNNNEGNLVMTKDFGEPLKDGLTFVMKRENKN